MPYSGYLPLLCRTPSLFFRQGRCQAAVAKAKKNFSFKKNTTSGRMQTDSPKPFVEILCSFFRFLKQTPLFWKRDIRANSACIILNSISWYVTYCWMHVSRPDTFILCKRLHARSFLWVPSGIIICGDTAFCLHGGTNTLTCTLVSATQIRGSPLTNSSVSEKEETKLKWKLGHEKLAKREVLSVIGKRRARQKGELLGKAVRSLLGCCSRNLGYAHQQHLIPTLLQHGSHSWICHKDWCLWGKGLSRQ